MRFRHWLLWTMPAFLLLAAAARGATTHPEEKEAARVWVAQHLEATDAEAAASFFSFTYGDRKSDELLASWHVERTSRKGDDGRTDYTVTWTDPATGLVVRGEATQFADFPAVEWVLYFKNTGSSDTPILADILPVNDAFPLTRDKAARLHHAKGSECRLDDFAPQVTPLGPTPETPQGAWRNKDYPVRIASSNGRSSCGALPFFNLDLDDHGAMLAVGWTGDWAASFYQSSQEVCFQAGMQRTHFKLLPGEEVRTPRILLLFWQGQRLQGHQLLRQFILTHHTPTQGGRRIQAPVCLGTWGGNYAKNHCEHGLWWKEHHLALDYLWIDAGWFGNDEAKPGATVFNSKWWAYVGDWYPNPGYFPQGLKPVSDALAEAGMGLLLWLEPERVFKGTAWTKEHPEFLLGPMGDNFLFNLGDPQARQFLTGHLARLIAESHLGCYRQDFNMDPRPYWDASDAPDRVGIAEIRHITGMYAMWDELRQRFPDLLIDNCASGGRRIDLESISRSIPLWRSDFQCYPNFTPTGLQGQTHGLGLWVPLSTGCCDREDRYAFRSALGPGMVLGMAEFEKDTHKHFSVDWLRQSLDEIQAVRPYFEGDFYPLLSYSVAEDQWAAWQYDRPDLGEGMVLALRRAQSPIRLLVPSLQGLDPKATYEVRCLDTGEVLRRTGGELATKGVEIRIDDQPGSRLYCYRRLQ